MNKYFLFSLGIILFTLFLAFPHKANAHFPANDNTITVILHVAPNDNPIPGQQAMLYFDFGDSTNRFKLSKCTCTITVEEQGKQIYTSALIEKKDNTPSIWGTSSPYTFPNRDVYKIVLTGNPITPNAFQPFKVFWYFRVDQYPSIQPVSLSISQPLQKHSDIPLITGIFLGVPVIIILFFFFLKRNNFF